MARELATERGGNAPSGAENGDHGDSKSDEGGGIVLGRRKCLKLGAIAIAGGAGVGLGGSSVAAETDYETIDLEPGEQRAYDIGAGEAFENVLIDQSAEGSMFAIRIEEGADDWTIRNVGWKGIAPTGSGNREYTFLIHVRGTGRIENIFIDQRNKSGSVGSDVGAIWTYSDSHDGHIECRHNFIAGCGNNGSYDSGDGWSKYSGNGTVSHEQSYHRDNTPSNFRPGKSGSEIRNCVSIANDPEGTRGGYPASGSQLSRACWAWHNTDIVMENCAIWWDPDDVQPAEPFWATYRSGSEGDACELRLLDCDINASWEENGNELVPTDAGGDGSDRRQVDFDDLGYDPDISVLGEGVPTTPEMAAAGDRNLPPELGSAPGGGTGEFEEPEESEQTEEPTSTAEENIETNTVANQDSPSRQTLGPDRSESIRVSHEEGTSERGNPGGILMGSSLATIGATGYVIRRQFDWTPRER